MGERKVISKYYPPDFDPSKIPKATGVKKHGTIKVTMMLPMSIRCNTCGEYIGRGTKFNSKKETVEGETYLGLKIYRFYLRCKKCAAELAIRTDPQNSEYICESGATRNYEPWKESEQEKTERLEKEKEEKEDAMKALENRTLDSKREMEMLDALDELRAQSARNSEINTDQLLEYSKKQQELEEELQEQEYKREFQISKQQQLQLKRINDNQNNNENINNIDFLLQKTIPNQNQNQINNQNQLKVKVKINEKNVNSKRVNEDNDDDENNEITKKQRHDNQPTTKTTTSSSSLFQQYDSDDDE